MPEFLRVELAYGVDGNRWYGVPSRPELTRIEVIKPTNGSKRSLALIREGRTVELVISWPTGKEAGLAAKFAVKDDGHLTLGREVLRLMATFPGCHEHLRQTFVEPLLARGWTHH